MNTDKKGNSHLASDKGDSGNTDYKQFGIKGLLASSDNCACLRDIALSKRLEAGKTLFWEDDATEYVSLLTDGTIKAYKLLPNGRSQIIRFLVTGDMIASPFFSNHTFSAQALGDCTILRMPLSKFTTVLSRDPMLMQSLTRKLAHEMQQTQKQILLLGRMPAIERISNFLLDMAERQNPEQKKFEPDLLIELPMSRADIADYVGLSIETVSRIFSRFRRIGLIDLPRPNLVKLRDQSGLQKQSLQHSY